MQNTRFGTLNACAESCSLTRLPCLAVRFFLAFDIYSALRQWRRGNIAQITTMPLLSKLCATPAAQVSGGQTPPSAIMILPFFQCEIA